ncbi:Fe-S oxidoreductase [Litchfieldella qijiaojingensis]|uniref:Fe-S oxidoreductase n=1 Tax=Litchfieldella qijiaojingensis TaxID=980347 RepID=A0ABQ2YWH7_9GAMM|nr:DUF1289 domain-containing protein [Halomonas qijiaojingensis]GGX94899.1 Fe-S oxidoreductase [Halomonas qijiaojingensis]
MSDATPPQRIASPCTGVCRLPTGGHYCLGCHRTLDEIAAWSSLSDAERHAIMNELPQRKGSNHSE